MPTVPISGSITLDGQPLAGASVSFTPTNLDGKPAQGTTDSTGTFQLKTYLGTRFGSADGALPGDYNVMVTKYEGTSGSEPTADDLQKQQKALDEARQSGKAAEQAGAAGQSKLVTPVKYSNPKDTDLKATVKEAGNQPFTFNLKG